jgi:protein-S-isoprenylcysteine O-methyltransferase Ste14
VNKTPVRIAGAIALAAVAYLATTLSKTIRPALGLLVAAPSFVLMIISRRQLGASFSVMPKAAKLVTGGLYARIQHPMYAFLDLFLLGVIVVFGWAIILPVWAVLAILQMLQARNEEKVLAAAFGPEYADYVSTTWF